MSMAWLPFLAEGWQRARRANHGAHSSLRDARRKRPSANQNAGITMQSIDVERCERSPAAALRRTSALAQGAYYVVSGVWPLLNMDSFEMVTGPKMDRWLVRTVGLLISVI